MVLELFFFQTWKRRAEVFNFNPLLLKPSSAIFPCDSMVNVKDFAIFRGILFIIYSRNQG